MGRDPDERGVLVRQVASSAEVASTRGGGGASVKADGARTGAGRTRGRRPCLSRGLLRVASGDGLNTPSQGPPRPTTRAPSRRKRKWEGDQSTPKE